MRVVFKFSLMAMALFFTITSSGWGLERTHMIGMGGTILTGLPTGDFGSLVESGLGPGVNVEYFVNKSTALGINFGYLIFQSPGNVSQVLDSSGKLVWPVTQEWKMVSYGVFGKYVFNPEKEFSFCGKVGFMGNSYRINYERIDPPVPSDSSKFEDNTAQITAGLGVNFDYKERLGLFADFLYSRLLIKGVSVQFFSLNLGATVYFGGSKSK